jgi:hypothetical protein
LNGQDGNFAVISTLPQSGPDRAIGQGYRKVRMAEPELKSIFDKEPDEAEEAISTLRPMLRLMPGSLSRMTESSSG